MDFLPGVISYFDTRLSPRALRTIEREIEGYSESGQAAWNPPETSTYSPRQ